MGITITGDAKILADGIDVTALAQPRFVQKREHITDGSHCWCDPELNYVDPDTGAKVWVHKEPQ